MQNKTKPDLRQSERLKCPHRPHSTPKNCHCKKERTSSSISAYRGSVRFSSEFWPIMDPCGCWQRRWAATPQIPKEVHRDHLKPAWRLWSVRHVYVSLRCLPVILLGARQDLVPRAPNLVPRLPLIRVIQTVKSDFWPREYIAVSIVPNFHSSEFWPIMDPCGCWQRRWAATPQIPKEVHRDHLKPAWRLWNVRHVYVSLRCLPVILLGARQDLVPRAPNLVPRLPLIRVIQTVKSDFWPREYIAVSIVPNFHPCSPPPPPPSTRGYFFCPSRWLWNRSGFRVLFFSARIMLQVNTVPVPFFASGAFTQCQGKLCFTSGRMSIFTILSGTGRSSKIVSL